MTTVAYHYNQSFMTDNRAVAAAVFDYVGAEKDLIEREVSARLRVDSAGSPVLICARWEDVPDGYRSTRHTYHLDALAVAEFNPYDSTAGLLLAEQLMRFLIANHRPVAEAQVLEAVKR